MRDVAALAGVSLKTVSRVVNDEPGVRQDVRERVSAAVLKLDYRTNLAASGSPGGSAGSASVETEKVRNSSTESAATSGSIARVPPAACTTSQ